jgi:glycosyltransferase involved in cell wall biosynthesis
LKILHVSPYFRPARGYGGSTESQYRLCLNLARLGCDVRVLTTNADGPRKVPNVQPGKEVAVAAGFEVTYMGCIGRHAVSPRLLMRLLPEVRRAHVVHLTGVYSFTTIPTLLACRLMRKPLVWSPRGTLQRWRGSYARLLKQPWELACRIAAPRTTTLHLRSETERVESLRNFPSFSTAVIPNAVRVPATVKHEAADGTFRLGYIGRLHRRKGLENLLEACAILRDQDVAFSLVIAGAGRARYTRSLRRKIDGLGLAGMVRMAGEVHGTAKRAFFEALDLLVMPSHAESFASAVAEGLAFGVPAVASRGTPWAQLEDRGCGLWVDNSPQSLAQAIVRMRTMPLEEMGQRGRRWMSAEFSWDRAAREVCNAYSVMLGGTPMLADTASEALAAAGESASRH